MGALLGYLFERSLHEKGHDKYKDEFRNAFPLVAQTLTDPVDNTSSETIASRNVVNGLALVRYFELPSHNSNQKISPEIMEETSDSIMRLRDSMDAIADLLIHESVYQAINGNYERSGAAMDAATVNTPPPELQAITTPLHNDLISHRVCMLLNDKAETFSKEQVRERAEPRLATWFTNVLGDMKEIGCCVRFFYWSMMV